MSLFHTPEATRVRAYLGLAQRREEHKEHKGFLCGPLCSLCLCVRPQRLHAHNFLIFTFRNATGSLCPAKPKYPLVRVIPGCGCSSFATSTFDTSASRITVPF